MKTMELLEILEDMQKGIFTLNDFSKILNKSKKYSSLVLHRLKKRGLISEIERGKYSKRKSPYIIASNVLYPSYISFLSAFIYYGKSSQVIKKLSVVCLRSKKEKSYDNYLFKFIKFNKKRFFGYKREETSEGFIFVAEIEKAIIDSLFIQKYCPLDEIFNVLKDSLNEIDKNKLVDYALKMKSKVVLKRLGYLLSLIGFDISKKVKNQISNKYELLDILSKKGKKDKKWKLIINRNFDAN